MCVFLASDITVWLVQPEEAAAGQWAAIVSCWPDVCYSRYVRNVWFVHRICWVLFHPWPRNKNKNKNPGLFFSRPNKVPWGTPVCSEPWRWFYTLWLDLKYNHSFISDNRWTNTLAYFLSIRTWTFLLLTCLSLLWRFWKTQTWNKTDWVTDS